MPRAHLFAVRFLPDGRLLGGGYRGAFIFDVVSGQKTDLTNKEVDAVAVSPDGKVVALGMRGAIASYDLAAGTLSTVVGDLGSYVSEGRPVP